jgi:ceramide glucosyltransferase
VNVIVLLERGLLALGLCGVVTSTIFLGLAILGAIRFRQAARRDDEALREGTVYLPPVTLFKPLHGDEVGLEANLRSFYRQDYLDHVVRAGLAAEVDGVSRVEVIFCSRHLDDSGLRIARRVAAEFPRVATRFVTSGEPWAPNAKVCSLAAMAELATHDLWIVSDSDVRVGPEYLRRIVQPFADPGVGCATCLYRGKVVEPSLWSRLEAVGMTVEMSSGVAVANLLQPMRFALGPTMIARRSCVEEIGGFRAIAEYCADDFVLGNWIAAQGHRIVLSTYAIDHMVRYAGFADSIRHQIRWMRSTRFSRPRGHLGTCLTLAIPFALMAFAGALLLGQPELAWGVLGFCVLGRCLQAWVMARLVVDKRDVWTSLLLYPIRDLMGMAFWALSYTGNQILWRGEMYDLLDGGRMVKSPEKLPKLKTVGGD